MCQGRKTHDHFLKSLCGGKGKKNGNKLKKSESLKVVEVAKKKSITGDKFNDRHTRMTAGKCNR